MCQLRLADARYKNPKLNTEGTEGKKETSKTRTRIERIKRIGRIPLKWFDLSLRSRDCMIPIAESPNHQITKFLLYPSDPFDPSNPCSSI
jgi:hypothetical protein